MEKHTAREDLNMIQQTSQISLWETICEGKINKRQKQIIECFKKSSSIFVNELNNRQISVLTGLPINIITARVNELVKAGILSEIKKDRDPATNRLTIFWGIRK